jgi:predicted DNA-binding transcriptional regulator AlpA
MSGTEETLLTREEAAAFLRKPVGTLAAWAYKREGPPFYRLGRGVVYRRADIERWIERQRVDPEHARR